MCGYWSLRSSPATISIFRELDSESQILIRTVEALQKGLDLVNSRHSGRPSRLAWMSAQEELVEYQPRSRPATAATQAI